MTKLVAGSTEAQAFARAGARARWEKARAAQAFTGTILDAMDAAGLTGPSWAAWRVFWSAVFALPMDAAQFAVFRERTGRTTPPPAPVREAWAIGGRRAGKSRTTALAATYLGCRRLWRDVLAPGEQGVIPVIAADRRQARQVMNYVKGLGRLPAFAPFIGRILTWSVELTTGVTIEVHTASYKSTRGYTLVGVVADEVAFWPQEDSANPDTEILNALRPGMATVEGALLLGISSPYARRGELHQAHERFYGQDVPDVLVWVGPSLAMNPTLDPRVVARAYEDDPAVAAAEYGAEFRRDVEGFLTIDAVDAVRIRERRELAPQPGVSYVAFADPSGGSRDSFTLAIAHRDGARGVLDLVREVRPPFSPDDVCREFAGTLKSYRCYSVRGDHYAGAWPAERFQAHGIDYVAAAQTKSELYSELLPIVNAGRVELLDLAGLRAQLLGLERRTARSGRDSIDHPPGGHDDVANAAAGALVLAVGGLQQVTEVILPALFRQDVEMTDPAPAGGVSLFHEWR